MPLEGNWGKSWAIGAWGGSFIRLGKQSSGWRDYQEPIPLDWTPMEKEAPQEWHYPITEPV